MDEDQLAIQTDLITLESPFMSEPQTSISSLGEPDFESVWNSLADSNLRGWYDGPPDVVLRKLQGLQKKLSVISADQPPFIGMYDIYRRCTNILFCLLDDLDIQAN